MCNSNESAEIKISVIIPIYNAYNYLRPALDSVVRQTLKEIEIICVDDGSTDRSLDVIKEYQKLDPRIRIVTETNAGPALARNNGIKRARGEYLAFLDADDFYEPKFLESLYAIAKEDDLDIAISKYDIYNSRRSRFEEAMEADHAGIFAPGRVSSKNDNPDYILMSTVGSAWNKIFRRSFVLEKQLLFLQDVKTYEDVYFVVCAMSLAERVGKVFDVLVHHRIHSEQSRAKAFKKYFSQVPIVYLRIKEFLTSIGMYAPLFHSFLNLSATRCFRIYNLLPSDEREKFWNLLHKEYSEELGWHNRDASDFDSADICEFVANIQLYDHKTYRTRCSKGRRVKLEKLDSRYKGARAKARVRRFFGKIFRKKKD